MWAIPGGHKSPVKSRFFRSENGEGTEMEIFNDSTLGNIQTSATGSESLNDDGASRATSTHELRQPFRKHQTCLHHEPP